MQTIEVFGIEGVTVDGYRFTKARMYTNFAKAVDVKNEAQALNDERFATLGPTIVKAGISETKYIIVRKAVEFN